jgi:uncharacterized protein (DUF305 family)
MDNSNPCTDTLTDIEYIDHMIPHHQVAVDMSKLLLNNINDPTILHLCRDIINKQKYEIWEMEYMKKQLNDHVFLNKKGALDVIFTQFDKYEPVKSKAPGGNCNPMFFEPDAHMKHMANINLTSKGYLEHMIPHHQVAIDMSNRLLLHTNNSYLLDFCRNLINEQQQEILYMNHLLENKYVHKSELL